MSSRIFKPEGGLPRLIRFVPATDMPSDDTLTTYDAKFNLVIINKDLYETLDWYGKHQAVRATSAVVLDYY